MEIQYLLHNLKDNPYHNNKNEGINYTDPYNYFDFGMNDDDDDTGFSLFAPTKLIKYKAIFDLLTIICLIILVTADKNNFMFLGAGFMLGLIIIFKIGTFYSNTIGEMGIGVV